MSETKATFTPGPWRVSPTYPTGDFCIHAAGIPYQLAYLQESKAFHGLELLANANLIAAAPDMLSALRKAHDFLDSHGNGWEEADTLDAIRAAIAKATGA